MYESMEKVNNAAKLIAMLNKTALPNRLHTFPTRKTVNLDHADYKIGDNVSQYPLDMYSYVNKSAEIVVKITSVFKSVSVVFDVDFDNFHSYYHDSLRHFDAYDELYSNHILTMVLNSSSSLLKSCDNFNSEVLSKYVMTIIDVNTDARKYIQDMIKSCISGRNKTTLFMILDKYPQQQQLNDILYDIGKQFLDRDTIVEFVHKYMCNNSSPTPSTQPSTPVIKQTTQNLSNSERINTRLSLLNDHGDTFGINLAK
jgi:hypothetical protein